MPLCSMNNESEPRAASSCGVSVSKRPGLRASALQAGCVAARYLAAVPEKPLFLFHLPYRYNLNPYSVSFEGLSLGESDDFSLFAACNGGGSYQASYLSFYVVIIQCPADLYQLSYMLALFHNEVAFLRFIEVEYPVLFSKRSLQVEINDILQSLACIFALRQ